MPKKTAYSRSGAQRSSKSKQKSFELIRPVPHDTAPEITQSNKEIEEEIEVVDQTEVVSENVETEAVEEYKKNTKEAPEERTSTKGRTQTAKRFNAPENPRSSVTIAASSNTPQSASARLAARRQMAQKEKAQRSSASLISAENYTYVRKDLIFILILAVIMFSAIIIMHFIPAIGG